MIIADTVIWADFISRGDSVLVGLLESQATLMHPYVRGEIALGNLGNRAAILSDLDTMPLAPVARHDEVIGLIERARLFGSGIGYVDAHLLASTLLIPNGTLWTRDKRLAAVAERLGVSYH
jgi:predicted nucleic acid-binding protein